VAEGEEQPPKQEPPEPDDGDAQPADEPIPAPEPEPEIADPFERDTIRYQSGSDLILGVTLGGPKVGKHSIDVFTFGEFLAQLDRVVRGLTAGLEGLTLATTGRIPMPADAAPWRMANLAFVRSATVEFVLGEPEKLRLKESGEMGSPTLQAVNKLAALVRLEPGEAVEQVRDLDDRIGTDFAQLLALLADNGLTSIWGEPQQVEPAAVAPEHADKVRNALRAELEPVTSTLTVTGFLFRLDAKANDFKLQPDDETRAITGHYDDSLVSELRDAWSHRVVAELARMEQRYAYAAAPFRVEHSLRRIVRKLGRADGEDD
jgi:hypothetical protein